MNLSKKYLLDYYYKYKLLKYLSKSDLNLDDNHEIKVGGESKYNSSDSDSDSDSEPDSDSDSDSDSEPELNEIHAGKKKVKKKLKKKKKKKKGKEKLKKAKKKAAKKKEAAKKKKEVAKKKKLEAKKKKEAAKKKKIEATKKKKELEKKRKASNKKKKDSEKKKTAAKKKKEAAKKKKEAAKRKKEAVKRKKLAKKSKKNIDVDEVDEENEAIEEENEAIEEENEEDDIEINEDGDGSEEEELLAEEEANEAELEADGEEEEANALEEEADAEEEEVEAELSEYLSSFCDDLEKQINKNENETFYDNENLWRKFKNLLGFEKEEINNLEIVDDFTRIEEKYDDIILKSDIKMLKYLLNNIIDDFLDDKIEFKGNDTKYKKEFLISFEENSDDEIKKEAFIYQSISDMICNEYSQFKDNSNSNVPKHIETKIEDELWKKMNDYGEQCDINTSDEKKEEKRLCENYEKIMIKIMIVIQYYHLVMCIEMFKETNIFLFDSNKNVSNKNVNKITAKEIAAEEIDLEIAAE